MKQLIILFLLSINSYVLSQELSDKYILGQKYALLIGISNYSNSANNLNYSAKDATDFQNALTHYGNFKKENIKLLINENASRENIRKAIEGWLKSNIKENDLVIIYFSGHGTQIPDSDGDEADGLDESLIPYDFDNTDMSSLISDDIFAYWIRNLQSKKILIVFDNCFSGGAAKQKGVSLPGVKGELGKDDFLIDLSRELPKKGTALLAASKANQVSFESPEFKNGVFTHFLLNSISASSDNDFNKILDSREIFYSTRQKTLEYTKNYFNKEQEPIYLDMLESELEIFYLPIENKAPIEDKNLAALEYKAEQEKDIKKRIDLYKELYESNPKNISYVFTLAGLYEWNKEYAKAIDIYKVLNASSDTRYIDNINASIGSLYDKLGQKDLAIAYYSEAIREKPNDASLYLGIAKIYLSIKDTLAAIQNLNKSIDLQPLQKEPYLSLFYLYLNIGNNEVAAKILKNSYQLNSFDFETLYWHALMQKYYNKSPDADSLISIFNQNSGVQRKLNEINIKSNALWQINGKTLSVQESRLYDIQQAIRDYPYYDLFYKIYIQYVLDNKMSKDISNYKNKYLLFSKFNPDTIFINNYIKLLK
jgi:hypothetical protein